MRRLKRKRCVLAAPASLVLALTRSAKQAEDEGTLQVKW